MLRCMTTETRWYTSGNSVCLRNDAFSIGHPAKAEQIPQGRRT